MAFRGTLVAFREDAAAAPFLGHAFTEVVLQQPDGQDASNPSSIVVASRDKLVEATTGRDALIVRRKLTDVSLSIDFLDAATKAKVERLYHDGRPIYFCPNVGPETRWSFPLQRGLADFAGRKTLASARTTTAYFWDAEERVFRSWAQYEPAIDFGGHWTRCLKTSSGYQNKAAYPHPKASGHGWSVSTGSATLTYTEDIPTPVLQQRTVTNERGVVMVHAAAGSTASLVHDSAAALSTTNAVVMSVCLAFHGTATITFAPTGGGTAAAAGVFVGDGRWQLIKLGGLNVAASNQYRITVFLSDTGTFKSAMMIGPTMIANYPAASTPDLEDWNAGSVSQDLITASDTLDNCLTDFTFSCFFKWPTVRAGLVVIGNNVLSVQKATSDLINVISAGPASPAAFNNVQATLGVADGWTTGDWIHLVVRGSRADGICLFVNGRGHASNGAEPWEAGDHDYRVKIGGAYGDFLPDSGMSHARLDAVAWTDKEIVDHYHTYFDDRGRGIVEPAFGKIFQISEMEFNPRGQSSPMQYTGALTLTEVGPNESFAGLIRQEGDV
jgi:hypothetical protein